MLGVTPHAPIVFGHPFGSDSDLAGPRSAAYEKIDPQYVGQREDFEAPRKSSKITRKEAKENGKRACDALTA
jgi:hypothetical protein